jgi:hypothetical protein
MTTKHNVLLACLVAVGVGAWLLPASAKLAVNKLGVNGVSLNGQGPQKTMPKATGVTLTHPSYTNIQVEGGRLLGVK